MPTPLHRPPRPLAGVLPPALDAHPPARAPGNLLARDAFHSPRPRPRGPARRLLGDHWHHHVLLARDPDLGHEQPRGGGGEGAFAPLTHSQCRCTSERERDRSRRRRRHPCADHLAPEREEVGLGRGGRQMCAPCGRVLFRYGVGGGSPS
jgi:hypothetical protein